MIQTLVRTFFNGSLNRAELGQIDVGRLIEEYKQQLKRTSIREDCITLEALSIVIRKKVRLLRSDVKESQDSMYRIPCEVIQKREYDVDVQQRRKVAKRRERVLLYERCIGSQEELSLGEVRQMEMDNVEQIELMNIESPIHYSQEVMELAHQIEMSDVQVRLKERRLRFPQPSQEQMDLNFKSLMRIHIECSPTRPNTKQKIIRPKASKGVAVDRVLQGVNISQNLNSFAHDLTLNNTFIQICQPRENEDNSPKLKYNPFNSHNKDYVDILLFDPNNTEDVLPLAPSQNNSGSNYQQMSEQVARDDDIISVQSDHLINRRSSVNKKKTSFIDDFIPQLQTIKETQSQIYTHSRINLSIAMKDRHGVDKAMAFYDLLQLVKVDARYEILQDFPECFGDIICNTN